MGEADDSRLVRLLVAGLVAALLAVGALVGGVLYVTAGGAKQRAAKPAVYTGPAEAPAPGEPPAPAVRPEQVAPTAPPFD
jgi:hypothetical protein